MKVFLFALNWSYGGVESRMYRFFKNLKKYNPDSIQPRIFSVNESGRKPLHSLSVLDNDVEFIKRKDFLEEVKKLKEGDVLYLFSTGDNAYDQNHINNKLDGVPPYFEFFKNTKAIKGVYIFGHFEILHFPFYKEIINEVDFVGSAFLVNKDRDEFIIKNFKDKKNVTEEHYEKPIWFFNVSLSPKERLFGLKILKDRGYPKKNLKSAVYSGRVTFEKDIQNVVSVFQNLEKKNFDTKIYGFYGNSRQMFFLKQKFGDNVTRFFKGEYNSINDSTTILRKENLGICLRKRMTEDHYVLENTVIEYILNGVIPVINQEFALKRKFELPLVTFNYDRNDESQTLEQIFLDNYKRKDLDDIRINNLKHILRYNNGQDVVGSFINFLKNNFQIKKIERM